ncbi:hypothetical protein MF672_033410 [Actinomadura sp. ATCC 31491]|uniref:Secreted protein n=1 Tax=Actinomadura luzonensis TaxID=2805427 RepID=A0ABT0G244_9ACTN|nr:hypothetical protein [Actinomadura luzonensis]MCK2218659.1 hypothetical protein [Actinomadura luzonensis]
MRVRRLIAAVAAAFALSAGLFPAAAMAASGRSLGVPFTYQGVRGLSVLPVTFTAGDCRQTGLNQTPNLAASAIQVSPPQFDQSDVEWRPDLYTVSTFFGDVWHASFDFRDSAGNTVFSVAFDGPSMRKGSFYNDVRRTRIFLTQAQFDGIAFVDWHGDC